MISPSANHTFRLSYNQAFRAPSVINSYLDTTIILATPPIPPFGLPFVFPVNADGNVTLEEETLEAIEAGYTGSFGDGYTATVAVYRNKTENSIDFYQAAFYNSQNPPPGWILPPLHSRHPATKWVPQSPGQPVQLPQHRRDHRPGRRAVAQLSLGFTVLVVRQLLLPERSGVHVHRAFRPELAAQIASQNRPPEWRWNVGLGLRSGPLVRQRQRQLSGRGLLG